MRKKPTLIKIVSLVLVCASILVISSCGEKENDFNDSDLPEIEVIDYNAVIGNDTKYDCVYQTGTEYYVFEVISTKEKAEEDAERAGAILSEKFTDIKWFCCVVDKNEIYLGEYDSSGYTPFVYEKYYDPYDLPPYTIPFTYYFGKYLSMFGEKIYYEYDEYSRNMQGVPEYTFTIKEINPQLAMVAKLKMKTVAELVSKTLGNNVVVRLRAFEGSGAEILIEASNP